MPLTLSLLLPAALALTGAFGSPARAACATAPPTVVSAATLPDAAHELRACVRSLLQQGAWEDVDRLLAAARAGAPADAALAATWLGLVDRLSATRVVDARAWARTAEVVPAMQAHTPWLATMVEGLAMARQAWATQDAGAFSRALQAARTLAQRGAAADDLEITRAARIVQAAVAGGQYERDEMQLLLDEARATEQALHATLGDAYLPVVIARELEADLWLQTDRFAAAAAAYRDVIAAHPGRVQPWLGLAEAYRRLGHAREAAQCLDGAKAIAPDFAWQDATAHQ